jgi:type III pantothenate kinase
MNLVIDIGNSKVKFFLFENNKTIYKEICDNQDFKKTLDSISNKNNIKNVISSSVSSNYDLYIEESLNNSKYISLSNDNLLIPFKNNYKTKKSLGQDRIALVSSAIYNYHNQDNLIIDLGTCITYDFVDSNKIYHGGAISPGFKLRYSSLNTFTSNLPLLEFEETENIIGSTTNESIHSGIYNGVIAEINNYIDLLKKEYPNIDENSK